MISSLYFHSRSQAKPLRIGVLVDDFLLIKVFRQVLEDIASTDFARLELVVVNQQPQSTPKRHSSKLFLYLHLLKDPASRQILLYSLYQKFDQKRLPVSDPTGLINCADILGRLPRMDVAPITKRFVHRFPDEAIKVLRSYNLDVVLRFGFNILRGEVLKSSQYGVWSFHHGDNEFYRGGPALFWEVVEDNPCSSVILQVLTEKLDDGFVLCKSHFATERGLSRSRNVAAPYWGSTHFVVRKLHELHERGWEVVQQHAVPPAPYQGKTDIYRAPTNSQMLKWLVPKMASKLNSRLNPFRGEKLYHWRICLARTDSLRLLPGPTSKRPGYQWIPCPPGHSYADPFLLHHDGQLWLFFEDYLYGEKRGVISCAPVRSDLSIGAPTHCLDLAYHLSYPFVFHHDGEVFMIPESARNQSVELWRATAFPFSWKLEKTLFHGSLVDTTPIRHKDRWYFFTTITEPPGNAAFGALFSADQLTGQWTLHPRTPISTDVRYARSAGGIHALEGRLLRPVQDCSENYGRCIHVEEILELTPDDYRAQRLHTIEPDWEKGLAGTHTYGYCAGVEVLDAVAYQDRRQIARHHSG